LNQTVRGETKMAESNKCAHTACQCLAAPGSKYCSTFCEDSKDLTTLVCDCGHPACEADKL
jgi:hypothetical protein